MRISILFITIIFLLTGCGGGSSGSTNTSGNIDYENSGLQQRPVTATFQLPLSSGGDDIIVSPAFPNLPAFENPVFATHSGDGSNRLFVVEQRGQIQVFTLRDDPSQITSSSTFLNIEDRVSDGGEMGLLGLAFDPNYPSNGYFYVYYTANSPRRSVLSRFQVSTNPDQADADSESIILEVEQPYSNHNGGTIAFGPDGYLYFGLGDGGSGGDPEGHGQNTATLLGSLLRIQPITNGYNVPADNPFVGDNNFQPEIWAYGLRNPYRFSFDRSSGLLWLADVGQSAIEEINVIEPGGNYGWNWFEGTSTYQSGAPEGNYQQPIYEYGHNLGQSITGGYVYRGSAVPSLAGQYIYGDFVSSQLWALSFDENMQATANVNLGSSPQNISGFAEDESGELYIIGYGGTLYSLKENEGNPVAGFPLQLSDTGLFTDTASLTPASGLIEYNVNTELWSDYALKRRWIALPNNSQIQFDSVDLWQFPVESVFVKHFTMEMLQGDSSSAVHMETRVLIHQNQGWQGVTYRWNEAQTDATLVEESATEEVIVADINFPNSQREQTYFYPGPTDCLRCHTSIAGRVLGPRTQQLNGNFDYAQRTANQLTSWNHIGLFDRNIGEGNQYSRFSALTDSSASLEQRSRDYLDANCAFCHQPGGPTPVNIDLRASTLLTDMGLLAEEPNSGNLGIDGAKLIYPGNRQLSILWQRMNANDDNRMPTVGSHIQDPTALSIIGDWIDSL